MAPIFSSQLLSINYDISSRSTIVTKSGREYATYHHDSNRTLTEVTQDATGFLNDQLKEVLEHQARIVEEVSSGYGIDGKLKNIDRVNIGIGLSLRA